MLLGHMGRDEALADRLPEHTLHVVGQWQNPGLVEKAKASGGQIHLVDSITDVEHIADLAQALKPDMFITNFDDALAAGVVDVIKQRVADKQMPDLLLPCPDKATARIEWDKFYLREIIDKIDPGYNPINFMVQDSSAAGAAISFFESEGLPVAIKPRNLTGGKGVKVMDKHLDTFKEALSYALHILNADNQTGVEIQEKIEGHEFTLQLFTDGVTMIKPPVTYDYPYREDGDSGPGTGGMGTFTMPHGEQLPFMSQADYDEAASLMERVLQELKDRGLDYKGVLYPTFFKTQDGLKIVEINARGGDPELINILDLMEDDVDFGEVLKLIALGELREDSVRYKKLASAMLYLVSPDYGYRQGPTYDFTIDAQAVSDAECRLRFAAAEQINDNQYRTVGSSRVVGLSALGDTPWQARHKIDAAIVAGLGRPLPLQQREEVAQKRYIKNLVSKPTL
ncbi:MAG: hypothetical protein ACR2FM_00985 [Candidatus Saccharimonadales bacterium]